MNLYAPDDWLEVVTPQFLPVPVLQELSESNGQNSKAARGPRLQPTTPNVNPPAVAEC